MLQSCLAAGLALGSAGVAAAGTLSLYTASCQTTGVVTVTIDMSAAPGVVVGGQFFLKYDKTVLDFVSAVPGGAPFTVEIFESVSEPAGTISYAVGVLDGGPGTSGPATLATLTFNTLMEVCTATAGLVYFDLAHAPPSTLTDNVGAVVPATLANLPAIRIDETKPVITTPAAVAVNADAGGCDAAVTVPALVTMDACSGIASIINSYTGTANASGTYPSGTTPVTWTVTDNCGNFRQVVLNVTVDAVNDLNVAVELASVSASVTRCITFELFECPGATPTATVTQDLAFSAGSFSGTIEVPCGNYTCITARDKRHTLRRTDNDGDFAISGTIYVADFTASGASNDSLIGGNLNDDLFIDILDFGIFVGQFGSSPGGNTPCPATTPHADISGNGVVFTEDFTYIATNFLASSEANCCTVLLAGHNPSGRGLDIAPESAPVIQISMAELRRRGLGDLEVADLNHDGWLDLADVLAFLSGQYPE